MNVERLHSLLLRAIEDIEDTNTSNLLVELRDWTQQLASNPQDPNTQREFSERRSQLMDALSEAASNSFSPGMASDLDELGISRFLGDSLAARIEAVFSQNEFTLAVASDQIIEIESELDKLSGSLSAAVDAFETLRIAREEPGPGVVEASVIIPRFSDRQQPRLIGQRIPTTRANLFRHYRASNGKPSTNHNTLDCCIQLQSLRPIRCRSGGTAHPSA